MPRMQGEGKLGAYRTKDGAGWDVAPDENVLYLGAAQGVTARWMSDLVQQGTIVAIEKSAVAGLGLLATAKDVDNIVPYVGDAREPSAYAPLVPGLGIVYQDVAQRDQVDIFLDNVQRFHPRRGFLAVKARSIAVERDPEEVFEEAVEQISKVGDILDVVPLDPFHKDHAMIVADFDQDA